MATLADALREITTDLRTVTGLTFVPDDPPEQVHEFPACLVYTRSGHYRPGSADGGDGRPTGWGTHTVTIEVMVPRSDLALDVARVKPFVDTVPAVLLAGFYRDRFGGTVVTLGDPRTVGGTGGTGSVRYEFVLPEPGGLDAVGYRFELDVSLEESINV